MIFVLVFTDIALIETLAGSLSFKCAVILCRDSKYIHVCIIFPSRQTFTAHQPRARRQFAKDTSVLLLWPTSSSLEISAPWW